MNVVVWFCFFDWVIVDVYGVGFCEMFESLVECVDIVFVYLVFIDEMCYFVDDEFLFYVKENVIIINMLCGEFVDMVVMGDCMWMGGFCFVIDVFECEFEGGNVFFD